MSNTSTLKFNRAQTLLGILGTKPLLCHTRKEESSAWCGSHPEGCEPGNVFECERCKRLMPFCWGAADAWEEFCDTCAVEIMREAGE